MSMRSKALMAFVLLVAVGFAAAAPAAALQVAPGEPDPGSEPAADKIAFFLRLIAVFPDLSVTVEQLQLHFNEGWGLGDLMICAAIASDTGIAFEDVLAAAATADGWGEVANMFGLQAKNLGQIVSFMMAQKNALKAADGKPGNGHGYGYFRKHPIELPQIPEDPETTGDDQVDGASRGSSGHNGKAKGKSKS